MSSAHFKNIISIVVPEAEPEPVGDGLSEVHRAGQHAARRHRARQAGRVGHQGQGWAFTIIDIVYYP